MNCLNVTVTNKIYMHITLDIEATLCVQKILINVYVLTYASSNILIFCQLQNLFLQNRK